LGGDSNDSGYAIALDRNSNVYVTGMTYSDNFPTENPIFSSNSYGVAAFLTKLNPDLSELIYSTYINDADDAPGTYLSSSDGIAVDAQGAATIVGSSDGGDPIGYLITVNPQGTAEAYSTIVASEVYFASFVYGVAIDSFDNIWVTGAFQFDSGDNSYGIVAEYGPAAQPISAQPFFVQPTGNGEVDLNQGSLQLTVGVPITEGGEPGFSNVTSHQIMDGLVEDSNTIDTAPIVRFQIPTTPYKSLDYVSASLVWEGGYGGGYNFNVGDALPGETLTLAIQLPTSVDVTGAYEWQATTTLVLSPTSIDR
jgi:hypothetical protein